MALFITVRNRRLFLEQESIGCIILLYILIKGRI